VYERGAGTDAAEWGAAFGERQVRLGGACERTTMSAARG
jgi:hypothetical protein